MRKKHFLILAAAALVVIAGIALFRHWANPGTASLRVTLRYVPGAGEPVFWVTNHTDKSLIIDLQTIEIKTGQTWTLFSQISTPGLLYVTNKLGRNALLPPHTAGCGGLLAQKLTLPTNTVWRVRASVGEKLTGAQDVVAAVVREPRMLEIRRNGHTNFPLNPFRKDVSRFGHLSQVVSGEVVAK